MSSTSDIYTPLSEKWSKTQLFSFRTALFFFGGLIIPIDPNFYKRFAEIKWNDFKYHDIDIVANYFPWFANNGFDRDFSGLLTLLIISAIAALVWGYIDPNRKEYNRLKYILTTIIRFKIAIAMFHFGWVKFFPLQMPYPSLSQLNTNLGDFTPGKLYWVHIAAAPKYETFIGFTELLAALLIFFKRTSIIGLLMLIAILLPVLVLNISYDAGVQLKSASLLIMSIYLLLPNIQNLYSFIVNNDTVKLVIHHIPSSKKWHSYVKTATKTLLFLIFFVLYGVKAGLSYYKGESHMRRGINKGIEEYEGFYDVKKFVINRDTLPYSLTDTLRWENVIFEKWNTISIKSAKPVSINLRARNTELFATVGRHYYSYKADTLRKVLYLKNRTDTTKKLSLYYHKTDDNTLILSGIDERKDSIYMVLDKIDKKYPLVEGRYERTYIP